MQCGYDIEQSKKIRINSAYLPASKNHKFQVEENIKREKQRFGE